MATSSGHPGLEVRVHTWPALIPGLRSAHCEISTNNGTGACHAGPSPGDLARRERSTLRSRHIKDSCRPRADETNQAGVFVSLLPPAEMSMDRRKHLSMAAALCGVVGVSAAAHAALAGATDAHVGFAA